MIHARAFLIAAAAAWLLSSAAHALPAFPGAEGAGAETRGGRGGRVIAVTTLADAGPGSLRAAVEAEGPRIVVFRVSGTIALASDLVIEHPFITIAGQSAPGGGVTLRDRQLVVKANEVVIRYIRSRLGDQSQIEGDAISIAEGANILLDHCSASWSTDETLSVSQNWREGQLRLDRVTVQWSIIAEALDNSVHSKGAHGYGSLIRGSFGARYSFHHNLWAHHRARMPRPGNFKSAAEDADGLIADFRNNVLYNWQGGHSGYNADADAVSRYNFIGNYYLPGPDSRADSIAFREESPAARAYFAGNMMDAAEPADPWSLVRLEAVNPHYRSNAPFDVAPVTTESADRALEAVLARAGASLARDAVDARIVESVRARAGRIVDSQSEVGGWPELASGEPYADQDGDGMSDAWERAHGLNPSDANDGVRDRDGDGYTNAEEFLNALAVADAS
jgi:Bacterial TSP3 repeat